MIVAGTLPNYLIWHRERLPNFKLLNLWTNFHVRKAQDFIDTALRGLIDADHVSAHPPILMMFAQLDIVGTIKWEYHLMEAK